MSCDVCVIGSGAGGAAAAYAASRSGRKVILVEEGSFHTPADFNQREAEMFPRLYRHSGLSGNDDASIHLLQGRGLGGSTVHNTCLIKKLSPALFEGWRKEFGLSALSPETLEAKYQEVYSLLEVVPIAPEEVNSNNAIFQRGCSLLGFSTARLHHNRKDCAKSGYCEVGCAFDAKNNAMKSLVPRFIQAGGVVLSDCRAVQLISGRGQAERCHAEGRDPLSGVVLANISITAKVFIISGSAIGGPVLLLRSGISDPYGHLGRHLRIHPGISIAARFAQPVYAWRGIPQSIECADFLEDGSERAERVWLLPSFAHPASFAALIPALGKDHAAIMHNYPNFAAATAMLHDSGEGKAGPRGKDGSSVSYWPGREDRRRLLNGMRLLGEIFLAAGAVEVMLPFHKPVQVASHRALADAIPDDLAPFGIDLVAVHPMGTARMSDDPALGATDSTGRLHGYDNLFIADTSLFCTSTGGPPQCTTYALGLHVGEAAADRA